MRLPARPDVAAPAPWQFPDVRSIPIGPAQHRTRLHLAHQAGQHVLAVRIGVGSPLQDEPAGQEGVGLLVARSLDLGTRRRGADEIAIEFERRGVAFGAGIGERGLFLDLDLTVNPLRDGLALLGECLVQADFPAEEVARQVRGRLAEISHERADASSRAAVEFLRTHYAPGQRSAVPMGGSAQSIATMDRTNVQQAHARMLETGSREIVVAGDLTGVDVEAEVAAAVSGWPVPTPAVLGPDSGAVSAPTPAARVAADAARVVLVERPGAVQTEIYLGREGPGRRDPRGWGVFQVLSTMFGGSPRSRLDSVLREEHGYTYGVSAGFRPRSVGGLFLVSAAVRTEVTVEALRLMRDILDVDGSDFTDAEVRGHADYLARTAPGRYGTADVLAGETLGLALDGLGPDFVTDNHERLLEMDAAQAVAAWNQVRHEPWTVVLVGDVQPLVQAVADLGLGPVSLVPAGAAPADSP